MSTYAGAEVSLVSTRRERTDRGISTVRVWEGTDTGINATIATLTIYDQWSVDDSDAPKYRLTVRTPDILDGDASYEYSWEIVGSDLQRDMKEHPWTLWATTDDNGDPLYAGEQTLRNVLEAIDNKGVPMVETGLDEPRRAYFERFYKLLLKGQTHFLWPHYVLRFTATVSPYFTGGLADDGAERIWSAAQIIDGYSNFPMSVRIGARVTALQEANPSMTFGIDKTAGGYTWGWLKKPMSEVQLPDLKVRLTTEWELELWESMYTYRTWS